MEGIVGKNHTGIIILVFIMVVCSKHYTVVLVCFYTNGSGHMQVLAQYTYSSASVVLTGVVPTEKKIRKTLLLLFLTFSALVANPKKTTLHGGQSRSWSAEQGKKEKEKVCSALLVRRKNNK